MASAAELVAQYKKCGAFDEQRAKVFKAFAESEYAKTLAQEIEQYATQEVEQRQQQLLDIDRSKAAAVLEGAVTRSVVQSKDNQKLQQKVFDDVLFTTRREVVARLRSLQ